MAKCALWGSRGRTPYKAHSTLCVSLLKKLPLLQSLSGDVPVAPKQRQELKIITVMFSLKKTLETLKNQGLKGKKGL